jgi:hypothetical protein
MLLPGRITPKQVAEVVGQLIRNCWLDWQLDYAPVSSLPEQKAAQGSQGSHPAQHVAVLYLLLSAAAVVTDAAAACSLLWYSYALLAYLGLMCQLTST